MRRSLVVTVFASMVVLGLAGYYAVRFGFYPVALVDGSFLSAGRYSRSVASVRHYYAQALTKYSPEQLGLSGPLTDNEVRRATLDKMVEDELVRKSLEASVGEELPSLITSKLAKVDTTNPNFTQSVTTLYGLTVPEFREAVLIPQARVEILQESEAVRQSGLQKWLTEVKTSARIVILAPDLRWDGTKVVFR